MCYEGLSQPHIAILSYLQHSPISKLLINSHVQSARHRMSCYFVLFIALFMLKLQNSDLGNCKLLYENYRKSRHANLVDGTVQNTVS